VKSLSAGAGAKGGVDRESAEEEVGGLHVVVAVTEPSVLDDAGLVPDFGDNACGVFRQEQRGV
jgi:hypothetical protein